MGASCPSEQPLHEEVTIKLACPVVRSLCKLVRIVGCLVYPLAVCLYFRIMMNGCMTP